MIATMTSKGQLTVPKDVRIRLDLHAGDKLDFVLRDDGSLDVVPLKQSASRLRGFLVKPAKTVTIEQMNTAIAEGAACHGRD